MSVADPLVVHLPPERYDDRGAFAQGGTAAVHLTMDRVLGRSVATKIAKSGDPLQLARFRREACITAQLEHPNIVPVHDLGGTWFTMKRVEGATLSALVRGEPYGVPLLGKMIDILIKVCDALAFAHDRKVIHRDLKPENVMVGRFGQVYLMDWGIAQVDGAADTPFAGTTAWVAPEQARGETCDPRTDVWGVGGLLYYALCGARPNQGATPDERVASARASRRPLLPAELAPKRNLPFELVRIAMKALEPDPARRYPDIAAMAVDLQAVRDGGWWFELRVFPVDAEIVREGDEADTAYILVQGVCEVRQNGGPIAELGPGEIFGEAALLVGGPRTASVVALTEVVTRVITRDALEAELGRDRWMGALVRGLARRFHELSTENLERKH
jgi:serine/threonine protein kinase